MGQQDSSPSERGATTVALATEDLNRMANSLSVVRGYSQLLQRRLQRGRAVDEDELLQTLAHIDTASRSLTTHFASLVLNARSDGEGHEPESVETPTDCRSHSSVSSE